MIPLKISYSVTREETKETTVLIQSLIIFYYISQQKAKILEHA